MKRWNYYWRLLGTAFSFAAFGIGGIVGGFVLLPLIHFYSSSRQKAHYRCQYAVHLAFRFHVWLMASLGVLTYEIKGVEKLKKLKSKLVIANHPSLIDVVFIIAQLPRVFCVVKSNAWSNPFMRGAVWATGYIPGNDAFELIDACAHTMADGNTLLIFPEGTRTKPGQPMRLKRGAAAILLKTRQKVIPITISCSPPVLAKAQKWYKIPEQRPHFKIFIGDPSDPTPFIIEGERASHANRRLNRMIKNLLQTDGQHHE